MVSFLFITYGFICIYVKFGLSEKHTKFEKIFLMVLTNQLIYLVNIKTMRKIFSNYVCFSKSPNFTLVGAKWQRVSCNHFLHRTHGHPDVTSVRTFISWCSHFPPTPANFTIFIFFSFVCFFLAMYTK